MILLRLFRPAHARSSSKGAPALQQAQRASPDRVIHLRWVMPTTAASGSLRPWRQVHYRNRAPSSRTRKEGSYDNQID